MGIDEDYLFRRVTIRYRDNGQINDVVGRIVAQKPTSLTIESRSGDLVVVNRDSIVASRLVPDRPARTRPATSFDASELTTISSRGWPAYESAQLGAWTLRASGGFTLRANSVAAVDNPQIDYGEATEQVQKFYRSRSLPVLAQVVLGSAVHFDLVSLGWHNSASRAGSANRAAVMVTDLRRPGTTDPGVSIVTSLTDEWLALYPRAAEYGQIAIDVLTGPPVVGFGTFGNPVTAIARVAVTGEWAGIYALEVEPQLRRRGVGSRLMRTALAWAVGRGADKAYVQVAAQNAPAVALYEQLGFARHHEYDFFSPDPQSARS